MPCPRPPLQQVVVHTSHLVPDVVQSELEHHSLGVVVPGHGLVAGRPHGTAFDGTRKDHLHGSKQETEQ